MTARDLALARRARRHGARYAVRIIREARRADLAISLGFAVVEQEVGGYGWRNIFGHDGGAPFAGERVTKAKVRALLAQVDHGGVSNGVGLPQLTWPPLIREAQHEGGAHRPTPQLRVAFRHLSALIKQHGKFGGVEAYNGSGAGAYRYATQVLVRQKRWHVILG